MFSLKCCFSIRDQVNQKSICRPSLSHHSTKIYLKKIEKADFRCSIKKMFWKFSKKSQKNPRCSLVLVKLQALASSCIFTKMRHCQHRLENLKLVLFTFRSTSPHTLQVYHFLLSSLNSECIYWLVYIVYFTRNTRHFLSALLCLHYFLYYHCYCSYYLLCLFLAQI